MSQTSPAPSSMTFGTVLQPLEVPGLPNEQLSGVVAKPVVTSGWFRLREMSEMRGALQV